MISIFNRKKRLRSFASAIVATGILTSGAAASAADANWQTIQYHPYTQFNISCGAALLCDIELQPGEQVRSGLGSLAQLFDNQLVQEGEHQQTPHIVLKPSRAGIHENVMITTNRRVYRLYLISTNSEVPTYTRFDFTDEQRAREHHARRMQEIDDERSEQRKHDFERDRQARQARPMWSSRPTSRPLTALEQACASKRQPGWRLDKEPRELKPRQVCETNDHTFIAMPLSSTSTNDLPIPFVVASDGDRPVNYRFDARDRVFIIDGTAPNYVLIMGTGRHATRLRVQRIEEKRGK